jgi:Na+-translocating ferredoxin:NAD+ oxidoreductase RnfG subunit
MRSFLLASAAFVAGGGRAVAKTYLTVPQAQKSLWGGTALRQQDVTLTKEQMKSIQAACKVRVRSNTVRAWKAGGGGWFIVDQIIGKHEFIDMAVAIGSDGKVKGVEILEYRESYGHQIINVKWLAQFIGKGPGKRLEIDKDIRNISGATLSSVHVMEGVNRLIETWSQVLRNA